MKLDTRKLRAVALLTAAMVLVALPMAFLVEDFVRDLIVTPVAFFTWVTGVILGALPESLFFGVVVAIGVIVAVRSLHPLGISIWRAAAPAPTPRGGQVSQWRYRLEMLQTGKYSRTRFHQHLAQLITDVLAHDERLSRRAVIARLSAGEIDVPEGIRAVVQSLSQSEPARTRKGLRRRLQGLFEPRSRPVPPDIGEFVTFLETHLAISPAPQDDPEPPNGDEL